MLTCNPCARLWRGLLGTLAAALMGGVVPVAALAADPAVPGEVLVKLRSDADLQPLTQRHGLTLKARFGSRPIYRFGVVGNIPVAEASRLVKLNMAAVSAMSKIAWSEKPTPRR